MKGYILRALIAIVTLTALTSAQLPPTTVQSQRPSLRRDQTQRTLAPKIIQNEDERAGTQELIEMINLPSGGVRRRATLALGRIGSPAAVTRLVDKLSIDRNPEMRALAAFALGEIESQYAAPDLLARLDPTTESSAEVRARAVEALGKIASNKISADALENSGSDRSGMPSYTCCPTPRNPRLRTQNSLLQWRSQLCFG